jgi:hypothetical protein
MVGDVSMASETAGTDPQRRHSGKPSVFICGFTASISEGGG